MSVNDITAELAPYPAEALRKTKNRLIAEGRKVYDFGTGDPHIPTWEDIRTTLLGSVEEISQYPSVRSIPELSGAQKSYLLRRFGVDCGTTLDVLSSSGSKEAIFHSALSIVGRCQGRRSIAYPNPGYPVYRSGILFAGGRPIPCPVNESNRYLMTPWHLPRDVQDDLAAVWINYPHNPTGAMAPESYFRELIGWAEERDVLVLSDECYVDIYEPRYDVDTSGRPRSALEFSERSVIAFFSLSKRSGMTGYRSGFFCGPSNTMNALAQARANFGAASPSFVQRASAVAWGDEQHVEERRRIFAERMQVGYTALEKLGAATVKPDATFYLWARLPSAWGHDDVGFATLLAQEGLLVTPSSWLGENTPGFFRLAMVPGLDETRDAVDLLSDLYKNSKPTHDPESRK